MQYCFLLSKSPSVEAREQYPAPLKLPVYVDVRYLACGDDVNFAAEKVLYGGLPVISEGSARSASAAHTPTAPHLRYRNDDEGGHVAAI